MRPTSKNLKALGMGLDHRCRQRVLKTEDPNSNCILTSQERVMRFTHKSRECSCDYLFRRSSGPSPAAITRNIAKYSSVLVIVPHTTIFTQAPDRRIHL